MTSRHQPKQTRRPSPDAYAEARLEEGKMPGHDKLVGDIKKVVEEVTQPMEQRLKEYFDKGLRSLGDEIKHLISGNKPPAPRP